VGSSENIIVPSAESVSVLEGSSVALGHRRMRVARSAGSRTTARLEQDDPVTWEALASLDGE
jgi:hypothetical protein